MLPLPCRLPRGRGQYGLNIAVCGARHRAVGQLPVYSTISGAFKLSKTLASMYVALTDLLLGVSTINRRRQVHVHTVCHILYMSYIQYGVLY